MKNIYDPGFKYICAVKTDIRQTFKRIRREQKEQAAREEEARVKVQPIRKVAK